jgi:two-component system chemotaxis sensor kinase CheA
MKIPLTMAIIDAITVRTGGSFYSIPLIDILEFLKVRPEQITDINGGQVINIRGEIMPVIKLYQVFNIKDCKTDITEGIIIVISAGGKKACLLIDEIIGSQQIVIKSLSEYLGRVEGLSGCAILGDGSVSFIIDSASFISRCVE